MAGRARAGGALCEAGRLPPYARVPRAIPPLSHPALRCPSSPSCNWPSPPPCARCRRRWQSSWRLARRPPWSHRSSLPPSSGFPASHMRAGSCGGRCCRGAGDWGEGEDCCFYCFSFVCRPQRCGHHTSPPPSSVPLPLSNGQHGRLAGHDLRQRVVFLAAVGQLRHDGRQVGAGGGAGRALVGLQEEGWVGGGLAGARSGGRGRRACSRAATSAVASAAACEQWHASAQHSESGRARPRASASRRRRPPLPPSLRPPGSPPTRRPTS